MCIVNHMTLELNYLEEHLSCENYIIGDKAIWGVLDLKEGDTFAKEKLKRPTLLFVLSGKIRVSAGKAENQEIPSGKMFLIPAGDNFYFYPLTDTTVIRCSYSGGLTLCNKYSIQQLNDYIGQEPEAEMSGLYTLDIHPVLLQELEIIHEVMKAGLSCIHYQHMKMEILFIELRGLYKKEELAGLFFPVFSTNLDFKNKILETYSATDTVKELVDKMNMSTSNFKRKFLKTFGIQAKQWLLTRKKEKLIQDIRMTDMTVAELADKYGFSVNYLTSFCKEHFGNTPTELRAGH